ncbi:MAG TPA: hypothetical protein DCP03_05515 [Polaromonas sp.]|uniref:hypothetical protein n=1 Tax=Polaromonas sp. UBA4122 TaxID=1947074 RepID=UPI000EBF7144|nr:hypothetical protein [Polaromonas sp. UBA4122]HAL37588.1 hypothetical protein [Polaromonas sp.]
MYTYRFVLQGCSEAQIAEVNKVAYAAIHGIKLPIKKSAMGYYFMSVDSSADHDKVRALVANAFEPLLMTVALLREWAPSHFSELS